MRDNEYRDLRLISSKLRAIAYLIENHKDEVGYPLDIEEVYWGLGEILNNLCAEIRELATNSEKRKF